MKKIEQHLRKTATGLLLINWSRFQMTTIRMLGSTLLTGVNGTGKTTILDAVTYCLVGNTSFNKAAKDRDRDIRSYVRGDTRSKGENRYLREKGEIISSIAMEFYSPDRNTYDTVGVCIESPSVSESCKSSWFVFRDVRLSDVNFAVIEDGLVSVTPKNRLNPQGRQLLARDFMGRDNGVAQILRTIGLRVDVKRYRQQLVKMMAFNPENNIDRFIQDCVLDEKNVDIMVTLREQRQQFEKLREVYEQLRRGKEKLENLEKTVQEYEQRNDSYEIRKLLLQYQELIETAEKMESCRAKMRVVEANIAALEKEQQLCDRNYEAALQRWRAAGQNQLLQDMNASIHELENRIHDLDLEIHRNEEDLARLLRLEKSLGELLEDLPEDALDSEEKRCLLRIAENYDKAEQKRAAFLSLQDYSRNRERSLSDERTRTEDGLLEDRQKIGELRQKIQKLQSNILSFPEEAAKVRDILDTELKKQGMRTDVRFLAETISEIRDESWHRAIETFLGRKRFYLIVEPSFVPAAMQILRQRKLYHGNFVMSDKLPESEIQAGSAAEQLITANPWARRYLNYLLNGIHLCDSLQELSEYPLGGLMKDGMLAKSYAVSLMNIGKTTIFMGKDAVKLQLLEAEKDLSGSLADLQEKEETLREISVSLGLIKNISWDVDFYDMDSPRKLQEHKSERRCWKVSGGVRGQPRTNERRFGVAKPNSEASQMYCCHSSYCSWVTSANTQ